jgi:hypothetical protein
MATFTPTSPLSISYKKNAFNVYAQPIAYRNYTGNTNTLSKVEIQNKPDWLDVSNLLVLPNSPNEIYFEVKVNQAVANNYIDGTYVANLRVYYEYSVSGTLYTFTSDPFVVNIQIYSTSLLTISPAYFALDYFLGDALPEPITIAINTSNFWTVSVADAWLIPFLSSGTGNTNLQFTIDPTGLPIGNHQTQVTVSDGTYEKIANVYLNVNNQDAEANFLYVNPLNVEFISELLEINTTEKPITVYASESWTAVTSETWLNLSANSGNAGTEVVNLSVDSIALQNGVYLASATFTIGTITKTIYIRLQVIGFAVTGISSDSVYYASDRKKLIVTQAVSNAFLQADIITSTNLDTYAYTQEAPYHKGTAKLLIGKETTSFLKSVQPTNILTTRIKNNIFPINIGLNLFEINKYNGSNTFIKAFQNLWFLNGKTPETANKLCYIPEAITVTKSAVLSLSVRDDIAPTTIEVTGDATATFTSVIDNGLYVYNAILNLADLNLSAGQVINVVFGAAEVQVTIKPTEPETHLLAFENEWNEYEFFETTGFLTINDAALKETTEIAVEGTKQTKVVTIDIETDYTLNTGWLYSQEEVNWLAKMLNAKHVYFYDNNQPIEVVLTTKKLNLYSTRNHLKSYNIQFKKATK